MTQQDLYIKYLQFSKKTDTLPAKYAKFKKIIIDICYILGFKNPQQSDLDIFEKNLNKWLKDMETYEAMKHIITK